jgi:hypothetical protein
MKRTTIYTCYFSPFFLVKVAKSKHVGCGSFTDNKGLCGIPGLPTCGPHLSAGAKVGIGLGASLAFLLLITCSVCWWKRRQNIIRAQQIAGKDVIILVFCYCIELILAV